MNIKEIEKQRDELDKQIKEYYKTKELEAIENNKKYIGKYYRRIFLDGEIRYYKILQINPENKYKMYVLSFGKPKIDSGYANFINGNLNKYYNEYSLIKIENIALFNNYIYINKDTKSNVSTKQIDLYTEISEEEFNKEFNIFINYISQI